MKGYKFIQDNMKSQNGDAKWKLGEWRRHKGELMLCKSGFHACETALQSLKYIYGGRWFLVEARGKILKDDDKFVAEEMRLVKEISIKKILPRFAIMCARRCLKNFERKYPDDKRPRKAIEAAEVYLDKPTAANLKKLESARSAAWSAAGSAAGSARSAAWSAAGSAARSAAWSARSTAWSATGSAEMKWQEKALERLIKKSE